MESRDEDFLREKTENVLVDDVTLLSGKRLYLGPDALIKVDNRFQLTFVVQQSSLHGLWLVIFSLRERFVGDIIVSNLARRMVIVRIGATGREMNPALGHTVHNDLEIMRDDLGG